MAESDNGMIRSRSLRAGSLVYVWLLVGFVLGTLVLLFPIRWLTSTLQSRGASASTRNVLVILLVVLYLVTSLLIAIRANKYICNHPRRRTRWTIIGLATAVALLTAWIWRK
jgi:hypothetical protein